MHWYCCVAAAGCDGWWMCDVDAMQKTFPSGDKELKLRQTVWIDFFVVFFTCKLHAEGGLDGGGLDKCCLADVLQVFELRHAVVVDEVVVLLCSSKGSVDAFGQILHIDVLIVTWCNRFCQLSRMLYADIGNRKVHTNSLKMVNNWSSIGKLQ